MCEHCVYVGGGVPRSHRERIRMSAHKVFDYIAVWYKSKTYLQINNELYNSINKAYI